MIIVKNRPTISPTSSFVLDLIRIAAAWGVLLGHGLSFCGISVLKDPTYFPYIQNIGVVLLIMISGFLFAHSMSGKIYDNKLSFRDYFIDKACRIGFAFVPAVIFAAFVDAITISVAPEFYGYYGAFNIKTFVGNILQLQDIPRPDLFITSFGSARQFWTLAVEWWFYMLGGFAVLYVYPRVKEKKLSVFALILLVFLSIPAMNHLIGGRGNGLTAVWGLGILIYFVYTQFKKQNLIVITLLTVLAMALTLNCGLYLKEAYSIPFVLCLSVTVLLMLILAENLSEIVKRIWGRKFVKFLANYTYSLYLVHYSIMYLLDCVARAGIGLGDAYTRFWAGVILSNVVAIPFSLVFEKNSKALAAGVKKRLTPKAKVGN